MYPFNLKIWFCVICDCSDNQKPTSFNLDGSAKLVGSVNKVLQLLMDGRLSQELGAALTLIFHDSIIWQVVEPRVFVRVQRPAGTGLTLSQKDQQNKCSEVWSELQKQGEESFCLLSEFYIWLLVTFTSVWTSALFTLRRNPSFVSKNLHIMTFTALLSRHRNYFLFFFQIVCLALSLCLMVYLQSQTQMVRFHQNVISESKDLKDDLWSSVTLDVTILPPQAPKGKWLFHDWHWTHQCYIFYFSAISRKQPII